MAQIAKGQAVMTLGSVSPRLVAVAAAALGLFLGGAMLGGAPASAQEYFQAPSQDSPWYMPPAWVHPPQTGPKVRKLPGYYGNRRSYSAGSYGSFGNGCYGRCPDLPGLVTTSYGVVLQRPVVAIFDPNAYALVPLAQGEYALPYPGQYQSIYQASPPAPASAYDAKPIQPLVVPVKNVSSRPTHKPLAKISTQHGVRVIRPASAPTY